MVHALFPLVLCGLSVSCTAPNAQESAAAPQLTIDTCLRLENELKPDAGVHLAWMPEGAHYLRSAPDADGAPAPLLVVSAADGQERPLFDPAAMQRALAALPGISAEDAERWSRRTSYDYPPAKDGVLLQERGDLFFWSFGAERAARLTHDPDEEVGARLSPDGRRVAYIHDWNLHVVPTAGGTPLALTSDGNAEHLYGRLDWVYQEEIYGRGNWNGFWWSPDSRKLAFLILDESAVPAITLVDNRTIEQEVEVWRYPKAGKPNPLVRAAVVDAAGGDPVELDLSAWDRDEPLVVRVGWTPDARQVVLQIQDRIQSWLDLCLADPSTGEVTRLFRDATGVWIEPNDSPHWLPDGERFVWRSERDGWAHLYLYDRAGKLLRRLTEGPWEVDAVHGIDGEGRVWFDADRDDVKGSQLYRIDLEGGEPVRVTRGGGTHRVSLSPDCRWFVDTWSTAADPGHIALFSSDGERRRMLDAVDPARAREHGLVAPEFVRVPTRDGFEMEAMLIKPPGFDPARRYPVLCYTYGGPHAPQVRDAWGRFDRLFHQMLAQEGYLIWICDNRSASGKGLASVRGIYKNLGALELQDLEDGLDWLVGQGFADPERIGIWGWSYGGYMTSYALTHSTRFALGIAGAPVTDWRLYDTIYTERFMDTPQANPEGYDASSVLEAADRLSGELLLIHGTIDENVHAQNTLMLAERLQQAGKAFQLMLYPGNRHPVVRPAQRRHLYTLMADFVREHL